MGQQELQAHSYLTYFSGTQRQRRASDKLGEEATKRIDLRGIRSDHRWKITHVRIGRRRQEPLLAAGRELCIGHMLPLLPQTKGPCESSSWSSYDICGSSLCLLFDSSFHISD